MPNGTTSMAKLVGMPCGVAARLLLEGNPALKQAGILAPYTFEIAEPIRQGLLAEGIALEERYV